MLEPYIPSTAEPFDYQRAGHLLRRIMIGPTDSEIRQAVQDGYELTLQKLFTSYAPDTSFIADFCDKDPYVISPPPGAEYDAWVKMLADQERFVVLWWLINMIRTPMSLHEKMILFWHRHFALGGAIFAQYEYVHNTMLRTNALGNFKQMIVEQTKDTLMQSNLGLHSNFVAYGKSYINENYARELMELYTCGVFDDEGNPNYTQKDVYEAARSLTGWFYGLSNVGVDYHGLQSRFIPERWDTSEKEYFGKKGAWNSFDIIDILFEKRSTQIATRICRKLYRAFVCDELHEQVVAEMASTLLANNWEIQPVMRQLLGSRHFFDADNMGVLKKSHIEFVVGMIRQLALQNIPDLDRNSSIGDLFWRLKSWGEQVYHPPTVAGWEGGRDWVNSSVLPRRLQLALDIVHDRATAFNDVTSTTHVYNFNPISFAEGFEESGSSRDLCTALIRYLLPVETEAEDSETIFQALLDGGKEYEWDLHKAEYRPELRLRKCLAAIVTHPSYQLF